MGDGLILRVGVNVCRPFRQFIRAGNDFGNFLVGEQRGLPELQLRHLEEMLGSCPALVARFAEAAPRPGGELARADQGLCPRGPQDFLAPLLQVVRGDVPRGGIVQARLEDGQAHSLDVVERFGHVQDAEAVDHELRVFLGVYLDALAQLQVDDVYDLVRDDDHVGGAEAALHIRGNIHALLHQQDGRGAAAARVLDLAGDEGNVLVHRRQQFIRIELGSWANGLLAEVLADDMLCHGVTGGALGGVDALAFLELLFQQQRGRAVDAAIGRRGGESCVELRHYSFIASSMRAG